MPRRRADLEAFVAVDGEAVVAPQDVAAGRRGRREAGAVGLAAPGEVAAERVVGPVAVELGEGQLQLVTPPDPPGPVHPERVHLLVQAEVLLEADVPGALRAVVAEGGVGRDAEIAGVDLEAVGQAVPGAGRRLGERGRNQQARGKDGTDDGSHELNLRFRIQRCTRTRGAASSRLLAFQVRGAQEPEEPCLLLP